MTNNCFFLEGLPGSGKTSLSEVLKKELVSIDEILTPEKMTQYHNTQRQNYFLSNDESKINYALESNKSCFIDRGPLSTLFFNLCKFIVDDNHSPEKVLSWYVNKISPIVLSKDKKFRFIVIDISPEVSLSRKNRQIDEKDPWVDPISLRLIREMYLTFAQKHSDVTLLIDGSEKLEDIVKIIELYVQNI